MKIVAPFQFQLPTQRRGRLKIDAVRIAVYGKDCEISARWPTLPVTPRANVTYDLSGKLPSRAQKGGEAS